MELICPKCDKKIDSIEINVSTDIAKCRYCGTVHILSEIKKCISLEHLLQPPNGSKIKVMKINETLTIEQPRNIIMKTEILPVIITTIIIGVLINTAFYETKNPDRVFMIYTLPIWFILLLTTYNFINTITEKQFISITSESIDITKQRLFKTERRSFKFSEIQNIKMKHIKANIFSIFENIRYITRIQGSFGSGIELPSIITMRRTEYILDRSNDAEQEWVIKLMNRMLELRKQTTTR